MIVRTIPATLGRILEELELDRPRVVTRNDIDELRRRTGTSSTAPYLVEQLLKNGWLLPLKARGVWEFAPAARAGAFSGGDRFVELRATIRKRPDLGVAVAAESAAWLHGFAGRAPTRDAISALTSLVVPPALRSFRLVSRTPRLDPVARDGLPCWSVASLLVISADRPSTYRDWPNVTDWLGEAAAQVSLDALTEELTGRPRSAWARLAYLVDKGGRVDLAGALIEKAPPGHGPYFLGRRDRHGHHDGRFDVIDSALTQAAK